MRCCGNVLLFEPWLFPALIPGSCSSTLSKLMKSHNPPSAEWALIHPKLVIHTNKDLKVFPEELEVWNFESYKLGRRCTFVCSGAGCGCGHLWWPNSGKKWDNRNSCNDTLHQQPQYFRVEPVNSLQNWRGKKSTDLKWCIVWDKFRNWANMPS